MTKNTFIDVNMATTPEDVHKAQLLAVNNALFKATDGGDSDSKANIISRRSINPTSTKYSDGRTSSIFLDKNTRVSFDMLSRLAYENTIAAAVINTRMNQVANCSRPSYSKYELGYRMVMTNDKEEPTEDDLKIMHELEQWLLTCGSRDGTPPEEQYSFEDFLKAIVRDRLVLDQCAVDLIPNYKGELHHFLPFDGSSVRYVNEYADPDVIIASLASSPFHDDFKEDLYRAGEYKFVQTFDGRILQGFTPEQIIVKHANPTTKLGLNGYPIGELEQVINQIASYLFGETHTRLFFMQGFSSKGILHIKGDIPDDELEAFRQHFYAQLTGTANAFRTPIMAGIDDVKWVSLNNEPNDMQWKSWLEHLIKILCAVYLIDPSEINFDVTRGGGNTINEGNRNQTLLQASRDKGLIPLFRFLENLVNDIIRRLNPKISERFRFEFTGIRNADISADIDRWTKEIANFKTLNEVRKENDLPEIEDGDIILNQIYWQAVSQRKTDEKNTEMQNQAMMQGQQIGPDGQPIQPPAGGNVPKDGAAPDANPMDVQNVSDEVPPSTMDLDQAPEEQLE